MPVTGVAKLLREKREEIHRIATAHGARNLRVFGSCARGNAGPASDVDLLVDTAAKPSSWFPAGLIVDLEDLLGCRVDVVTEGGLNPLIRERVLREAVPL